MMLKEDKAGILLEKWKGVDPELDFTLEQLKDGWSDKPFRKVSTDRSQAAHRMASSQNAVLEVYPDAILVGGPKGVGGVAGVDPWFWGWLAYAGGGAGIYFTALVVLDFHFPVDIFSLFISCTVSFFLFAIGSSPMRDAYFGVSDLPVLLNRRTRQVTFFKYKDPPFWRFWQLRGQAEAVTVPWDTICVRSYKNLFLFMTLARTLYNLVFIAHAREDARKPEHQCVVGYLATQGDEGLWMLYEHIRCYMDEGGPALQDGESLRGWRKGWRPQFPPEVLAAAGGEPLRFEVGHLQNKHP